MPYILARLKQKQIHLCASDRIIEQIHSDFTRLWFIKYRQSGYNKLGSIYRQHLGVPDRTPSLLVECLLLNCQGRWAVDLSSLEAKGLLVGVCSNNGIQMAWSLNFVDVKFIIIMSACAMEQRKLCCSNENLSLFHE